MSYSSVSTFLSDSSHQGIAEARASGFYMSCIPDFGVRTSRLDGEVIPSMTVSQREDNRSFPAGPDCCDTLRLPVRIIRDGNR